MGLGGAGVGLEQSQATIIDRIPANLLVGRKAVQHQKITVSVIQTPAIGHRCELLLVLEPQGGKLAANHQPPNMGLDGDFAQHIRLL